MAPQPGEVAAREAALALCRELTLERMQRASELIEAIEPPRDAVYRHFHHSFKQYGRFQAGIVKALQAMAALVSDDGGDPLAVLAQHGVHPWLLDEVRQALELRWSQERNEASTWRADMRLLASAYLQVVEVATASVEAASRMVSREGFLWAEHRTLDETDALFLEAWEPLGVAFRYAWGDQIAMGELETLCREALRPGQQD